MTIEIVLLAMVAAFLGLRLYSVLGKRTGHEQEHMPRKLDPKPGARSGSSRAESPLDRGTAGTERSDTPSTPTEVISSAPAMVYEPAAEPGIRQILAADRNFDVAHFMEGARAAYEMVLEAYWAGDKDELKALCDDDVYDSFAKAIDKRMKNGETLDNRLVRIESTKIIDAEFDKPEARITVRYDADIAAVTRNKKDEVIAGSLTDAVETHDIWTFSRDLSGQDPNWKLDETDEA